MSESDTRQTLVKALKPLDAFSVEMPMRGGIPDVNYIGGWIETKYLKTFPKNCDTHPVRFHHPLLKSQGLRAWKRSIAGGTSLVCAQVGREWFFFDGLTAKDIFGKMTRPEMREKAIMYFPSGLDKERLVTWLKSISKG